MIASNEIWTSIKLGVVPSFGLVTDSLPHADVPDVLPQAPKVPTSPIPLTALTPEYREDEHNLYLKRLEVALDDDSAAAPMNIALTGSYGSGKSSVLEGLLQQKRYRPVRISLSTINAIDGLSGTQQDPQATSNLIQKAIVKQILYREPVGKMSGSRFRRVDQFHWVRSAFVALASSVVLGTIAFLSGFTIRLESYVTSHQLNPWFTGAAVLAAVGVAILGLQRLIHGRINVKGFSAGSAQIELKEDESAFDRYLDEIVYFFAVSRCTAVIFEDLDRFHRIEIYEELRSLNVLLNNSRQIHSPVRFIYAMRDSLFEEIGLSDDEASSLDPEEDETNADQLGVDPEAKALRALVEKAADRAKFFDLVLPMVPFATMRTAIDLWRDELPESTGVSIQAIRVAANHVQDMRLIRNVRNEFHVFSEELTRNGLGGLESDAIFGLMLYKNIYLDDFESIRIGGSLLDIVESHRQDTITRVLTRWDESAQLAADVESRRDVLKARAYAAGLAIADETERAFRLLAQPVVPLTYSVNAELFDSAQIRDTHFWQVLSASGWAVEILQGTPPTRSSSLTIADLQAWIGFDPTSIDWSDVPTAPIPDPHDAKERDLLARAEVHTLLSGNLLSVADRQRFEKSLKGVVPSALAWDLISSGLIDQNFSLYVSRFYGRVVPAKAMNFILHVVQKGRYAPFAPLDGIRDVEAVMSVAGADFLSGSSALNVAIYEALADDSRLSTSLQTIGTDESSITFLDLYLTTGSQARLVIKRLAGTWTGTLSHLLRDGGQLPDIIGLVNSALQGISPDVEYQSTPKTGPFILEHIGELEIFSDPDQAPHPIALATLLESEGVMIDDIGSLVQPLRGTVFAAGAFKVSTANLEAGLGPSDGWSLDKLPAGQPGVLDRLVRNLDQYLDALPRSVQALTEQETFPTYVAKLYALAGEGGLVRVLRRSLRALAVQKLSKYGQATWTILARERRLTPSPDNLHLYVQKFGVDESIVKLLGVTPAPAGSELSEANKRELALSILLANDVARTKRAKWVKGLGLAAPIHIADLIEADGELVPYLVSVGVVEDSVDTFVALRDRPWAGREALIKKSREFLNYLPSMVLLDAEVLGIFESKLSAATKIAVLDSTSMPAALGRETATAIGRFFITYSGSIKWATIDLLVRDRCAPAVLISIFNRYSVKIPQLTRYLALMPAPWKDLSGLAARKPLVPNDGATLTLLETLRAASVVSSWVNAKGNRLRAQVRKVT